MIFATNFNFEFHHPKKDQCAKCSKFEMASDGAMENIREQHNSHGERAAAGHPEIAELVAKTKEDPEFSLAIYDLQSVFDLPQILGQLVLLQ
ncbi:MAG: hypothetical protein GY816_02335 [Cytophagales bacterium]|nr:hypothetical protein [Cytophagales bacterium]